MREERLEVRIDGLDALRQWNVDELVLIPDEVASVHLEHLCQRSGQQEPTRTIEGKGGGALLQLVSVDQNRLQSLPVGALCP